MGRVLPWIEAYWMCLALQPFGAAVVKVNSASLFLFSEFRSSSSDSAVCDVVDVGFSTAG